MAIKKLPKNGFNVHLRNEVYCIRVIALNRDFAVHIKLEISTLASSGQF